ncbi:MAG: DUF2244 domain-containing protein [Burkholderiaceae bacterium]
MPYRWNHRTEAGSHEWLLKRNCSLAPSQLAIWFVLLAVLTLTIAIFFATKGAWLVLPFAVIEISALAVAFLVFARHAADYERIVAEPGRLVVETSFGPSVDRYEQSSAWFRVEYSGRPRDLIKVVSAKRSFPVGRFVPGNTRGRLARELRLVFSGAQASGAG